MIFHALSEAADRQHLLLVAGGLCRFHRRLDGWVTIRELLILPSHRGQGLGRQLVDQAGLGAAKVVARCPANLPSNRFWAAIGKNGSAGRTIKQLDGAPWPHKDAHLEALRRSLVNLRVFWSSRQAVQWSPGAGGGEPPHPNQDWVAKATSVITDATAGAKRERVAVGWELSRPSRPLPQLRRTQTSL